MIAYFDTSSVVPLLISEPASVLCDQIWNESTRIVSARLLYPELRAALSRAQRMGRLTVDQLLAAVEDCDALFDQVDSVEITAELARKAGELADEHALRGYDAVHLAAALSVQDDDFVLVSGDVELVAAAQSLGLTVVLTRS